MSFILTARQTGRNCGRRKPANLPAPADGVAAGAGIRREYAAFPGLSRIILD